MRRPPFESGIRRDLREDLTHSDYLRLDLLLSAQQPLSRHHDELLFIIEESFQLWRFRHLKTVERIIGGKKGTGGSSGTEFLRAALDLRFFPELWDVRTEIGR